MWAHMGCTTAAGPVVDGLRCSLHVLFSLMWSHMGATVVFAQTRGFLVFFVGCLVYARELQRRAQVLSTALCRCHSPTIAGAIMSKFPLAFPISSVSAQHAPAVHSPTTPHKPCARVRETRTGTKTLQFLLSQPETLHVQLTIRHSTQAGQDPRTKLLLHTSPTRGGSTQRRRAR